MATTRRRASESTTSPDPADQAYQTWLRQPTPASMQQVITSLSPVIERSVSTFAPGNRSSLVSARARILAARAVRSYDPNRGVALATHVTNQLQPLRRYSVQSAQAIRQSDQTTQNLAALAETEEALRERLGRDPSDVELADHTGLSVRRLQRLRQFGPEISAYGDAGSAEPAMSRDDPRDVWFDYVYHDLDDIDRKIVDWKLGRNGPVLPGVDIARRLKLTPSAVTQRLFRIQKQLDAYPGDDI